MTFERELPYVACDGLRVLCIGAPPTYPPAECDSAAGEAGRTAIPFENAYYGTPCFGAMLGDKYGSAERHAPFPVGPIEPPYSALAHRESDARL